MSQLEQIPFSQIQAVIFDLDGTLYPLKEMRRRMRQALIRHYFWRVWRWREVQWIQAFRVFREQLAEMPHQEVATTTFDRIAKYTRADSQQVEAVIYRWMLEKPLTHLRELQYPEVVPLFALLGQKGKQVAIFSDFPAQQKIKTMGHTLSHVYSAHDPEIDQLKPNPKGLLHIAGLLGYPPSQCLMIGDRDERDGEAARQAGMPYWILDQEKPSLRPLLQWAQAQ